MYVQPAKSFLAAHIPILNPSLFVIVDDPASDDMDVRKDGHQPIQTSLASNICDKDNPTLFHTVVQQDTNGHQSGTTARHLRIQQQDFGVCGNVAGHFEVVQLRLTGSVRGLDKHATGATVGDDTSQTGLEDASTTEDNDSTNLARHTQAIV
jgi:hypothetical protein